MTRLVWGVPGERIYESGVDNGVLYPTTGPGVPWNGLISVNEEVSGGEVEPLYLDGVKTQDFVQGEDFRAVLEAFSAPEEFGECDGTRSLAPGLFATQQPRKTFGFSYRTKVGSSENADLGYKLHIVYNSTASPASRMHSTIADSVEPSKYSWTIDAVPPSATTYKPTAHFVIDSRKTHAFVLDQIQDILYGTNAAAPRLLSAVELLATFAGLLSFRIGQTSPGVYEIFEVDYANARTLMQSVKPSDPEVYEEPILWLDNSAGTYVVPKLVTGG